MKRLLFALLFAVLTVSAFAETATQQDQNSGFIDLATTTYTVAVGSSVYILGDTPGNVASWQAAFPNSSFLVLPARAKGFEINASASSFLIGHPNDVSSGSYPVGYPISAGVPFQWASRNPDQKRLSFRIINNGASTGYLMFSAWGE